MKFKPEDFARQTPQEFPKESKEGERHTATHNELTVDVYKLIHLTEHLPINEVPVSDYEDELEKICWDDEEGNKISPAEVIKKYQETGSFYELAQKYPELSKHAFKLSQADCIHPLLIYKGSILDGMHRLARAVIDNVATIKIKVIEQIPDEARIYIK